jgi:hypothetical protein
LRGHLDHRWGAGVAALGDPRHALCPGDSVGLAETEVQRRHSRGKVVYSLGLSGCCSPRVRCGCCWRWPPLAVAAELWARCGELALAAAFALRAVAPGGGRVRPWPIGLVAGMWPPDLAGWPRPAIASARVVGWPAECVWPRPVRAAAAVALGAGPARGPRRWRAVGDGRLLPWPCLAAGGCNAASVEALLGGQ